MILKICLVVLILYTKHCQSDDNSPPVTIMDQAPLKLDVQTRADADPELAQYLQPNDVDTGRYDNISTEEAEKLGLCARPCDGAKPRICYFVFTLENYLTVGPACGDCLKGNKTHCRRKGCITADGYERPILVINRQLPGPSIQVCKGDTVVVDVKNHMLDREVTIHWHGVYMRDTPWMDGVPMVTQCPIPCHTTFRYKFPAMPSGTFFYHSHVGLQKMDGLEGSLVIRAPKSVDGNGALYDFDLYSHVIILSDWMHSMTDSKFPGNTHNDTRTKPDALLINGQNQIVRDNSPRVPMHFFKVQRNKNYLFRLIGGSCLACPLIFHIEQHQLTVIAADGTSVEPFVVDTVTMFPGDRVDVVVKTDKPDALYWIQAKTMCDRITAEAVLQYEGDDLKYISKRPNSDTFKRGKSLNAMDINPNCKEDSDGVCWSHVNALSAPVNTSVMGKPGQQLLIAVDEYFYDQGLLFWQNNDEYFRFFQSTPAILTHLINNNSFVLPPFPPLTQADPLPQHVVCPPANQCTNQAKQPGARLCECFNVIKVELGSVAEIIFMDWGGANFLHPMHLHGTDMFIREQGTKPKDMPNEAFVQQLQAKLTAQAEEFAKNRTKPCVKDTVTIPPQGYAVVRVHFNNPGIWLCHCHYIFHSDTGMSMVFQVGERDKFVAPPPEFPKCNSYMPKVDPNEYKNINWEDEPTTA